MAPKYSLPEIERRWLVDVSRVDFDALPTPTSIVDRYLHGTKLRLRKMENEEEVLYKFVKKYGREGWMEPITNLYLDQAEYEVLAALPADEIRKKRYKLDGGSLDIIDGEPSVCIYEKEFETVEQASAFIPPAYVKEELLDGQMSVLTGRS